MWNAPTTDGAFGPMGAAVDDGLSLLCPRCGGDNMCEWCGACLNCGRCRDYCRCEDCERRYPKTLGRLRVGAPKQ